MINNVVSPNSLSCQCSHFQVEDLCLEVKHNNRRYMIAGCHRHPKVNVNCFVKALHSALMTTDPNALPFW